MGAVVEHEVVAAEVAVADRGRRLGHAGEEQVLEGLLHPLAEREPAVGEGVLDALHEERPGVPVLLPGGQVERLVEARHPVQLVEDR